MTIDEAIAALHGDLTPSQKKVVVAALRRQGLAAIRAQKEMATLNDPAAVEAQNALRQYLEAIRK